MTDVSFYTYLFERPLSRNPAPQERSSREPSVCGTALSTWHLLFTRGRDSFESRRRTNDVQTMVRGDRDFWRGRLGPNGQRGHSFGIRLRTLRLRGRLADC